MRIHVLGLPHTQTSEDFSTCAFTQKTLNLCRMMHRRGHEVFHYGVEGSNPECTKHIDVMDHASWKKLFGHPGKSFYNISVDGPFAPYHARFAKQMGDALRANTHEPFTEIVCLTWNGAQRTACEGLKQFLVESGIGYRNAWATWRVYESYAWMHMHLGAAGLWHGTQWYWCVIPNAFPVANFTPIDPLKKNDEFLFMGRLNEDKGVALACQITAEIGAKLVLVGQGDPAPYLNGNPHVRYLPPVGIDGRRKLMAEARALFAPTLYVEPFGGVAVEAQLSGTPVVTTDYGVFSETVLHGVTGWRCRTFEQFVWAAKNIQQLDPAACVTWARANYSLERVALMYEEFFQQILNVRNMEGKKVALPTGFYERFPERTQLDWLKRVYPAEATESHMRIDLARKHEAPKPKSLTQSQPSAHAVLPERSTSTAPRVCVVVPCRGQAKYLRDALRSLIAQTMPDWQAVVVCGDEESKTKAELFAELDPRITVLPELATLGLADARNRGLRAGKPTPYCAGLDADDAFAPTYLERMLALAGPKTIASCNLQEFGDRHNPVDLLSPADRFREHILHGNIIHCASVFPRALWEEVGGYDPLMFCFEDWEFWIALAKAGANLAHIAERLFLYRIHDEAMTIRHRPYEEPFRAMIRLRHVDPTDARARVVLANMDDDLKNKIAKQRQLFPRARGSADPEPGQPPVRKLHLGAGDNHHRARGWLDTDIRGGQPGHEQSQAVDATKPLPFGDGTFDYVFSEHMIEHLTYDDGQAMLRESCRVLRPGGRIRISCPNLRMLVDLFDPSKRSADLLAYARMQQQHDFDESTPCKLLNWMVTMASPDPGCHKFIYDEPTLRESLQRAGFVDVQPCRLMQSDDPHLRDLEHTSRMPPGMLQIESFTLEATKPLDAEATEPHDSRFFFAMREARDPYRRLADCIHAVLGTPRDAIDIGCGIGLQTARLKELGWNILGADHAPAARGLAEPGIVIEPIDLTRDAVPDRTFDLVICTETAEHIEGRFADAVVDNVARRAERTILWSAAVPGQEWPGHVHLQPHAYWLEKFAARGWRVDGARSNALRQRMVETNAQHVACRDNFSVLVREEPRVSFVVRVHNEERTLLDSIESLLRIAIPIEIVVVLHRCTDGSERIARACARAAPLRHRMNIVTYETPISRAGLETFVTPKTSAHSIMAYYTFAFGLASSKWRFKWDGDFIATPGFAQWVEQHDWSDTTPTIINVGHRAPDSPRVVGREPYAHNCLLGFEKFSFWEVPRFPSHHRRADAPDTAAFIHMSDLAEPKAYWRREPWFMDDESAEAMALRDAYTRAVATVGPEPLGCARACNPASDAYLTACRAKLTEA
jgi:glycosyltransferase involved in cell wall biosynthesis/predicted SAM-dependent methyltransferase